MRIPPNLLAAPQAPFSREHEHPPNRIYLTKNDLVWMVCLLALFFAIPTLWAGCKYLEGRWQRHLEEKMKRRHRAWMASRKTGIVGKGVLKKRMSIGRALSVDSGIVINDTGFEEVQITNSTSNRVKFLGIVDVWTYEMEAPEEKSMWKALVLNQVWRRVWWRRRAEDEDEEDEEDEFRVIRLRMEDRNEHSANLWKSDPLRFHAWVENDD